MTGSADAVKLSVATRGIGDGQDVPGFGEFRPLRPLEPLEPLDLCGFFENFELHDPEQQNSQRSTVEQGEVAESQQMRPGRYLSSFLNLPVEIREPIYKLHLESEAKTGNIRDLETEHREFGRGKLAVWVNRRVPPAQPAITRVSRLIRQETLPYWYAASRFPIQFRITGWYNSAIGTKGTPNYEMIRVRPHYIYPMLRKLELCFQKTPQTGLGIEEEYLRFSVNLDRKTNTHTVEHTPTVDWYDDFPPYLLHGHWRLPKRIARLLKHFDIAVPDMIAHGGGVGNLTLHDYERLVPQPSWQFWGDMPEEG